ncbi:hypothetical protein EVAR_94325_1 [Eumeta japonica]|uniref:Uncharacterized protein n=1 Tax=Eumeta variegata TaxID=151549 RepID=A0A4C1UFV4_EUMVA|nr:hypothetical protein EVAR_94325_1 [Eumeta japonica]
MRYESTRKRRPTVTYSARSPNPRAAVLCQNPTSYCIPFPMLSSFYGIVGSMDFSIDPSGSVGSRRYRCIVDSSVAGSRSYFVMAYEMRLQ